MTSPMKWLTVLGCLLACGCGSSAPPLPGREPIHQELKLHAMDGPVPEMMTLYSLECNYSPSNEEAVAKITPETEFFHSWPVLGKKSISEASERQALWEALNKGIKESNGDVADCFSPRHGIRIGEETGQTDYVICFECLQIEIYTGEKEERALTSDSVLPEFNQVLKAAGIPIAPGGD